MSYQQAITPEPDIPCTPGKCLVYVQNTFNIGPKYPTAIAAWNASQHKHPNELPPVGLWVPGYATISDNEAGHVFDFAPDGSVWSSSHPTSKQPVHHDSLAALIGYYGKDAKGNIRLSYLGWTEDVEDTLVIKGGIMPSDDQIQAVINYTHAAYYNTAPAPAVTESWQGLLKQDFVGGLLKIEETCNKDPNAIKNKAPSDPGADAATLAKIKAILG